MSTCASSQQKARRRPGPTETFTYLNPNLSRKWSLNFAWRWLEQKPMTCGRVNTNAAPDRRGGIGKRKSRTSNTRNTINPEYLVIRTWIHGKQYASFKQIVTEFWWDCCRIVTRQFQKGHLAGKRTLSPATQQIDIVIRLVAALFYEFLKIRTAF